MRSSFIIELIVMILINEAISVLTHIFIPNQYLATIISSVLIAFVFAIIQQWVDRRHFYRYQRFWYTFFITGIVFCLLDFVMFII
jgi:hypothetical protein